MSDLRPEEPRPPVSPGDEPEPAVPAAAPAIVPAWANDPAGSHVPEPGAGPIATLTPAAASTLASVAAPTQAVAATPVQGSPTPPAGWYAPIPQPGAGSQAQAPAGPAATVRSAGQSRDFSFDRARWLPTFVVAAIIAAVTLGGIGLDTVIAAPSAGTVAVGGSVTITASPGWVLVSKPGDTSGGIQLQKANVILTAQVVSTSFGGGSASILAAAEKSVGGDTAQISYGDPHHGTFGGNDSTYVSFEATVTSGNQTGIVDGELVCMVVHSNETIVVVAAPQGHLDPVIDDVSAMLNSLRAG